MTEHQARQRSEPRAEQQRVGYARSAQRTIRCRYAEHDVSLADLAEEYSVGRSTIRRILHTDPAHPGVPT